MEGINEISGHIVDIEGKRTYPGTIYVVDGKISKIIPDTDVPDQYILPGFIDAHIHIESSMVTPREFARVALTHGTVATISDPHEIANVCGVAGVNFMIDNAKEAGLKFFFGAPSCVPATGFENAGATIDETEILQLLQRDDIYYLAEMMNYPGVLHQDPSVMAKIQHAQQCKKPIDGHAPGLKGNLAQQYIQHGITTDHECFTIEEALDKLSFGMKILIREGSAAKNFDALHTIIDSHPSSVMLCSDDKHPDDLLEGHINMLVKRALALGYDLYDILSTACINPVKHYQIPVGTLRIDDPADFIVVNNLEDFTISQTIINGQVYAQNGQCHLQSAPIDPINQFNISHIKSEDLTYFGTGKKQPIIEAIDGSLITEKLFAELPILDGKVMADPSRDILKIAVINRYTTATPAIGFIKNFGFSDGAIASTVAHDSHNIIVIGSDDHYMTAAVNSLIDNKGGLSAVFEDKTMVIPLPIAGLMSDKTCQEIGQLYSAISAFVKEHGCRLHAPYMTLSFMALLVIPKIKISDLGMFDAESFSFYDNNKA